MQSAIFEEVLDEILGKDPRYQRDAYFFVREALDYTQKKVTKANHGKPRHVTGPELLDGIREFALKTYGPMTLTLFDEWGLTRCEDFGEIVFNMVDSKLLGKTDDDSKDDFKATYEFKAAFRNPFLPSRKLPKKKKPSKPKSSRKEA